MKLIPAAAAAAAAALVFFSLAAPSYVAAQGAPGKMTELADGLKYTDTTVGTGAEAKAGQQVTVNYTGWLDDNGKKGRKFDSSLDRNQPFTFTLGAHEVIPGWDEGVAGMKVGGTRELIIPPQLGYGERGAGGGLIPPNATLIFDVALLGVK